MDNYTHLFLARTHKIAHTHATNRSAHAAGHSLWAAQSLLCCFMGNMMTPYIVPDQWPRATIALT
jgi:hypothetical protein